MNLRRAFNQVDVLDQNGFGKNGEYVGLDVKAMRTTKQADDTKHLTNSLEMFKLLLKVSRSINRKKLEELRKKRDFDVLDLFIMKQLMNVR